MQDEWPITQREAAQQWVGHARRDAERAGELDGCPVGDGTRGADDGRRGEVMAAADGRAGRCRQVSGLQRGHVARPERVRVPPALRLGPADPVHH